MKVNLAGRIKNIELPKAKPLLPLLEAVSNSIHAIEDSGRADGRIRVVHRRAILDLLVERLKRKNDEKFQLEAAIHELIFPLKTTSDDPGVWGHQNLWLVDERLAYHRYLASDKPLKRQEAMEGSFVLRKERSFIVMPCVTLRQGRILIERPGNRD
jgi:hypothetical protein